ncbi:Hypothetical protein FKW44_008327 [Caligus rogercresseyi]|uniref:Uncharacterized protein n=1 Tax=Caligus rogercresseyi TaxID=217165 RepID=A0A7T8KGA2_CALRO|nr:Hypothetical protein FKW44_008327 [Caligus rogercresseyi]
MTLEDSGPVKISSRRLEMLPPYYCSFREVAHRLFEVGLDLEVFRVRIENHHRFHCPHLPMNGSEGEAMRTRVDLLRHPDQSHS